MYKKILVPLDGSQFAEAILPHVSKLASLFGAEIVFLQIFELPHLVIMPGVEDEGFQALPHINEDELGNQIQASHDYLSEKVQEAAKMNIPSRYRIAYGPIASSVINIAVEEEADLVAMASHGSGGIRGDYGSVAAGVMQRIDRPLLIVRSQEEK